MSSKVANRAIFVIGWLLSPLTVWNDAVVNLPISYVCAGLVRRLVPVSFLALTIVFYWLTNIIGILMMLAAGKNVVAESGKPGRAIAGMAITIAIYSVILIILYRSGILKPF